MPTISTVKLIRRLHRLECRSETIGKIKKKLLAFNVPNTIAITVLEGPGVDLVELHMFPPIIVSVAGEFRKHSQQDSQSQKSLSCHCGK